MFGYHFWLILVEPPETFEFKFELPTPLDNYGSSIVQNPKAHACESGNSCQKLQTYRLQLKRVLLWYRFYPKLHQMVTYRSSGTDFWTNLRQISLRVFFTSNKLGKMTMLALQNTNLWFLHENNL